MGGYITVLYKDKTKFLFIFWQNLTLLLKLRKLEDRDRNLGVISPKLLFEIVIIKCFLSFIKKLLFTKLLYTKHCF